jgi:DNA-binding transcriptional ArsR family regulator
MEMKDAVAALGALAQDSRLEVFRLLVRTGPEGLPAGEIAGRLSVAPATLSFHLAQLRHAGLVTMRRDGRSLIYSADYDGMNGLMSFLTENCCAGTAECRIPICDPASASLVASATLVRGKPKKRLRQ